MSREPIAIARPDLGEAEWLALKEPLESGWVTQGPRVAEFERQFAQRHGVVAGVATTSCTTALQLILAALDIGPGDDVIVPAFTWVATANAVVHSGATPVFADVSPDTFNVDPSGLARLVSPRTRAVIPVHLFGLCADMDSIRAVLPSEIAVIEDAACAAGADYKGRPAGSLGDAAAFSFHPRKVITTGEGGMVTTDDGDVERRLRVLRDHGASVSEEQRHRGPAPHRLPRFDEAGFNFRMTDLQGAIGVVQLRRLDGFIAERSRWAAWYRRELAGLGWLRCPGEPTGWRHGWQAFVCRVDERRAPLARNALMDRLHARGIATRPGTHSVPHLDYYRRRFGYGECDFPNALACERTTLALPLHNRMNADDYRRVVDALKELD